MKKITRRQYEDIRLSLAGDFSSPCIPYDELPDCKCGDSEIDILTNSQPLVKIEINKSKRQRFYTDDKDISRIMSIFDEKGITITESQAQRLWELYSDSLCAGWLSLPADDEEVFVKVTPFFKVIK